MIGAEASGGLFDPKAGADASRPGSRRTRPVYPYPIQAVYKGSGDPDDAANWRPKQPR